MMKRNRGRARIFEYTPDGKNERIFAYGIRNPVGIAIHPETGDLWTSVNERDGLGDHLVPDYVTRVQDGGFLWLALVLSRANQDPRSSGEAS
jgi:glucose/arabinose dehydrogenase